ncbi:MAG: PilN domain-containing protein [Candidatus Omnitrophota bacterium]
MKTLGVYITDNLIRMGLLNDAGKQSVVKEFQAAPATLKSILKKNNIQPDRVILYIPRTIVSIRYLRIPAVNDAEVDQMVAFEQASSFPFKPEELSFGHAIVSKGKDGYSSVMLAAVQKDLITRLVGILKSAGLVPDEIAISTVSVFNQLRSAGRLSRNTVVVNADNGFSDVLFIKDNDLAFSRAIPSGDLERELDRTIRTLQETGQSVDAVVGDSSQPVVKGLLIAYKSDNLVIDLLPQELKARKIREQQKRSLVYMVTLIVLNLAIIANIVFMKVKAQDAYKHMLKSETAKIEDQAQAIQKKMRKAQILLEYSASGKIVLGLLSELYRTAPAGVVLSSLDISGKSPQGAILLVGQAPSSEVVLKFANAMKGSGFIKKTDVNYITKRNLAAAQMVDFEIRAGF